MNQHPLLVTDLDQLELQVMAYMGQQSTIVIDSGNQLHQAMAHEIEVGIKNMRMFVVKDNAVIHSESAIYASRLRQRISDLHKQDPRAKYYLLTRSSQRWELYCGKKPFNNSIVDRFKPLLPRAVPGVLQAYQLICPEDA